MQDISGKSENHAGLITVAIGLVKLWSTKYEIQQHLWQRFIFTKTSQSGSTTNRIGAERYPLAETFSPCTVARDSNASQVEENQDGGWRVFFKRQVGMLLDDFVEINSSDLLWTCFRVVLFPPWQFQWNLCCLKFQETFGKPYKEQVTTFHGCPPLKRRFSGPFQMAGGWVNLLLHFPVQPRDLIREGLLQFSNFSDVLEGNGRMESFRDLCLSGKFFTSLKKCELKRGLGPRSLDITKGHKSFTLNLLQICFACVFWLKDAVRMLVSVPCGCSANGLLWIPVRNAEFSFRDVS